MPKFPGAVGAVCLLAPTLLTASLAGCSGGGLGLSNEVIVRNDADPYNLDAAQQIADFQCAARGGGGAQFVMLQNNARSGGGQAGGSGWGPPDIIYRCAPAGSARS